MPVASCKARQVKSNTNGTVEHCPSTSEFPVGQKLFHYVENDDDGLHHEDISITIPTHNNDVLCEMDGCPPLFLYAQTLQENGQDAAGCPKAPTCV